jgi:hypothetical protein
MNKWIRSDVGISFVHLKQTDTKKLREPKENEVFFVIVGFKRGKKKLFDLVVFFLSCLVI